MYNEVIQKNPKLKSEAAEVTSKSTILEDDNPFKDTPINNKEFDETTFINADYRGLKNIDLIKPCLKRYLAGYVKSQFRKVEADEFMVATLLPVQRFKKQSDNYVYGQSRGMI